MKNSWVYLKSNTKARDRPPKYHKIMISGSIADVKQNRVDQLGGTTTTIIMVSNVVSNIVP